MRNRITITVLLSLFIAACGGDEQTATFNWESTELAYSYPYQGQEAVPLGAPVVLYFSDPLDADEDEILEQVALYRLDGEDEVAIDLEVLTLHEEHDSGITSAVLRPDAAEEGRWKLDPAKDYRVALGSLSSELGDVGVPEQGIAFRTRGESDAARSRMGDDSFYVTRIMPDGNDFQVMDFSTLRVQFSQPVDRDSLRYGEDGTLALLDDNDAVVPARIYLKGHFLTIAPREELEAGRDYRLEQRNDGLRSVHGETLDAGALPVALGAEADPPLLSFTAGDTRPRATMVQEARSSEEDDTLVSRLTGAVINAVPVTAVLLGEPEDNTSFQEGDVFAELGHVPSHPEAAPLRVPRGNLLKGSSLDVEVAGEVPAGFKTGDITVTFVNDAMGYMVPNELQGNRANKGMPRHVRLVMDIAMNAEDPEANAALSQDLMHVELAGIAKVRDGLMEIDAVGVVEPEVLGLETATGLLSFNMVAYEDQKNTPAMPEDTENPELQSWTMDEEHQDKARPGDPVILNFTKPLDPAGLEVDSAVTLYREGQALTGDALRMRIDGTSLIVEPRNYGFEHNVEYELEFSDDLRGVNGEPVLVPPEFETPLKFSLAYHADDVPQRSPLVLTAYPGFPCPTSSQDWNLSGDEDEHHGRCLGGQGDDDQLPVTSLPANRPIAVQFSRDVDPDTVRDGGFEVLREVEGDWEPVEGRLRAGPRRLHFFPDEPWEPGQLYRYILHSNGSAFSSDCSGVAICSADEDPLPLQTRLLSRNFDNAANPQGGGPSLRINFRGAPETDSVLQELRNVPTFDVNADFVIQSDEKNFEDDGNSGVVSPPNSTELKIDDVGGLLLRDAGIGCRPSQSCPEDKFIHITGSLNAEIAGVDEDGVRVEVHPTHLMTTSLETHARILLLGWDEIDTGPQVMRIRYQEDGGPVVGHITEEDGAPRLDLSLDLYLDAPWLYPEVAGIGLSHNLRSVELNNVQVSGPITVLDDGRMIIEQLNVEEIEDIEMRIDLIEAISDISSGVLTLEIPAGGINLLYTSMPVKD